LRYNSNPGIRIFLVGNKADLEDRRVLYEEGESFKNMNNLDYFCESSAKTGFNTTEMFIEAVKILYADYKKTESTHANSNYISMSDNSSKSFKLNNEENEEKEGNEKKSSCFC
jgi:GTPase SAR1 family protein